MKKGLETLDKKGMIDKLEKKIKRKKLLKIFGIVGGVIILGVIIFLIKTIVIPITNFELGENVLGAVSSSDGNNLLIALKDIDAASEVTLITLGGIEYTYECGGNPEFLVPSSVSWIEKLGRLQEDYNCYINVKDIEGLNNFNDVVEIKVKDEEIVDDGDGEAGGDDERDENNKTINKTIVNTGGGGGGGGGTTTTTSSDCPPNSNRVTCSGIYCGMTNNNCGDAVNCTEVSGLFGEGLNCSNGIWINESKNCTDPIDNYWIKDYAYNGSLFEDVCLDSNNLTEFLCECSGECLGDEIAVSNVTVECLDGCDDGRCLCVDECSEVGVSFCDVNTPYNCSLNQTTGCNERINSSECGIDFECVERSGCIELPECSGEGDCNFLNEACGSDFCNLSSGKCEVVYNSSDDVCRSVTDDCDIAEYCSGNSILCPDNSFKLDTTPCLADSYSCTSDVCQLGVCEHLTEGICNDFDVCTDDSCIGEGGEVLTGCQYSFNTIGCNDGFWCTENDICSLGDCSGTAKICPDDEISCTSPICDEGNSECSFDISSCACTTPGSLNECPDDGNDCTDEVCNNDLECETQNNNDGCDDEEDCTTGDVCSLGVCHGTPQNNLCDDNEYCNGEETCDINLGCQNGISIVCSGLDLVDSCIYNPDSISTTYDYFSGFFSTCDEQADSCTTYLTSPWQDDIVHSCDLTKGCVGANCDDLNLCEDNSCSESYSDYCIENKLLDYNGDGLENSILIENSCGNSCDDCVCDDCSVSCEEPIIQASCVEGICGAICDEDEDCLGEMVCSDSCECSGDECDEHGDCLSGYCDDSGSCNSEIGDLGRCDITSPIDGDYNAVCSSGYCYDDYDGSDKYCSISSISCVHNALSYNDGVSAPDCLTSNQERNCDNGNWISGSVCSEDWEDYLGICGWRYHDDSCVSGSCSITWVDTDCLPYIAFGDNTDCWSADVSYCSQICGADCDDNEDCSCPVDLGCVDYDTDGYEDDYTYYPSVDCQNDCSCEECILQVDPNDYSNCPVHPLEDDCEDCGFFGFFCDFNECNSIGNCYFDDSPWPFSNDCTDMIEVCTQGFVCNEISEEECENHICGLDCNWNGNSCEDNCIDGDNDGWNSTAECNYNGIADCNESNGNINPGVDEICDDTIDNDCDGDTDGGDSDCGVSIIPVLGCGPLNIENGNYRLEINIVQDVNQNCIRVTAPNVVFDGNGHTITTTVLDGVYGVYSNQLNTTIKNTFINLGVDNPSKTAISLAFSNDSQIINNTLINTSIGIYTWLGSGIKIINNSINDSQTSGIYSYSGSEYLILNNKIENSSYGISADYTYTIISNNLIQNSQYRGIDLSKAKYNNLTNNIINFNDYGIFINSMPIPGSESEFNKIINNTANNNSMSGIYLSGAASSENEIINNTAKNNDRGLYVFSGSNLISDNIFCDNIDVDTFCESAPVFINNTCSSNTGCGNCDFSCFSTPQYIDVNDCMDLNQAGAEYKQVNNIVQDVAQNCIRVTAPNVVFDGNGHTITATVSNGLYGVYSDQLNTTIKNTFINLGVDQPSKYAISLISSDDSQIINNTIINTSIGIYTWSGRGIKIINNSINDSQSGIYSYRGSEYLILNNKIENSSSGISASYNYTIVSNNLIQNSQWRGIDLSRAKYNNLTNNIINFNDYGIFMDSMSVPGYECEFNKIINNTANNNSMHGIYLSGTASSENEIINNTAKNNDGGLFVYSGSNIAKGNILCLNINHDSFCEAPLTLFSETYCDINTGCGGSCIPCDGGGGGEMPSLSLFARIGDWISEVFTFDSESDAGISGNVVMSASEEDEINDDEDNSLLEINSNF